VVYNGDAAMTAVYTYQAPNIPAYYNFAPLLWTCNDLMYDGAMKNISYTYATGVNGDNSAVVYGQIRYEKSIDGQTVSNLQVIPQGRAEQKGDGSTRYFDFPTSGYQVSNWSDFVSIFPRASKQYDATTQFISAFQDRNGNTTNVACDARTGNVTLVTYPLTPPDATRATVTYTYGGPTCPDPNNQDGNNPYYLYSVKDERDYLTIYTRDTNKRVVRIDYADTGFETFDYNGFGQVTSHRLRTGGLETFTYDGIGRLTQHRDAYHLAVVDPQNPSVPANATPRASYTYHTVAPQKDRVHTITDARAKVTTIDLYNFRGQALKITNPLVIPETVASNTQMGYNPDGTLQWTQNELGHRTSYGYDDYKRMTSVTLPPRVVASPSPAPTRYYYDHTGGTSTTDYSHTDALPNRVTLPSGKMTRHIYNHNGQRISTTLAAANGVDDAATTTFTYDFNGNLKTVRDPLGQASGLLTQYFYDARNRISHMDDPMLNDPVAPHRNSQLHTVSWTYDKAGNKLTQINANDQLISFSYNPTNRLLQEDVAQTPSPVATTKYTYNGAGLLTTMQDPRSVATGSSFMYYHYYDLVGRKTRLSYPPDALNTVRAEEFTYDTAGNLATYTNRAGARQTFTYDNRNRHTSSVWSNNPMAATTTPTIEYDAASRIKTVSNSHAVVIFDYFNDNTLVREYTWANAAPAYKRQTLYNYDADGNRANITYPSGKSYSYGYYGRNDLWYVLDNLSGIYQAAYIYDLNGAMTTRYVGNNWIVTDASQRNPMNQVKHLEHRLVGTTRTFDYSYNSMGSRTSVQYDGGPIRNYGYDLAQEVTSGVESGAATYSYDANGNRTALNGGGAYVTNGANQQTTFNGQAVGHDANGNISSYGSATTYVYDAFNQLRTVNRNGGVSTFKYDGLGRKNSQTINGVTTYNVWDGWNLIEERSATNTLLHSYVYGASEVIERITGTTNRFYFQDGLGSTSHFSEESGTLLESYRYGTFGMQTVYDSAGSLVPLAQSAYDIRHLFTGQLWMYHAYLYDYRYRAYSPLLTRFLQSDPIGFAAGDSNLYRYCRNNPVNSTDPFGLLDGGASNTMLPPGHRPGSGYDPVGNAIGWTLGIVTLGPPLLLATEPIWVPALVFAGTPQGQRVINTVVNVAGGITPTTPTTRTQITIVSLKEGYDRYYNYQYENRSRTGGGFSDATGSGVFDSISLFNVGYNIQAVPGGWANFEVGGTHYSHYTAGSNGHTGSGLGGNSFGGVVFDRYGSTTAAAANWEASWGNGSAFGIGPPAGGGGVTPPKKKH
jgi:RHS repeat-associated protein